MLKAIRIYHKFIAAHFCESKYAHKLGQYCGFLMMQAAAVLEDSDGATFKLLQWCSSLLHLFQKNFGRLQTSIILMVSQMTIIVSILVYCLQGQSSFYSSGGQEEQQMQRYSLLLSDFLADQTFLFMLQKGKVQKLGVPLKTNSVLIRGMFYLEIIEDDDQKNFQFWIQSQGRTYQHIKGMRVGIFSLNLTDQRNPPQLVFWSHSQNMQVYLTFECVQDKKQKKLEELKKDQEKYRQHHGEQEMEKDKKQGEVQVGEPLQAKGTEENQNKNQEQMPKKDDSPQLIMENERLSEAVAQFAILRTGIDTQLHITDAILGHQFRTLERIRQNKDTEINRMFFEVLVVGLSSIASVIMVRRRIYEGYQLLI